MGRGRIGRCLAGLCALALATVGLGLAGSAGAASSGGQFKNLKPVKEPSPCKNDPGVSDTEITIGTIIPSSGPTAAFYASSVDGIEARVAKANAEGELGDRTINLVKVDDGGDAARNVTAAQQLVEDEDVFAIISESNAGDASGSYLNGEGVPVVGWQLGLPVYGTYPNYFGFQNANTKDIKTYYTSRNADVIKALGGTKLAVVGNSTANSATFVEQVADAANKTKGLKTAYKNYDIPAGTTDFGSVAQEIKESGADAMYTAMDNTSNTGLMQALKQANVTLDPVIFPGGYDPRVLGLPAYQNVYFGIEFQPFEVADLKGSWPGLDEYKKWMASEKPDGVLNQISAVGWLSAETMIQGIKEAGVNCPTRKAFINNLRLVDDYTAGGWFEPIDFRAVYNKPFTCVYYVHVENGAFVPQFDGEPFCAKQIIRNNKITKLVPNTTAAPTTTTAAPAS
jgi:branched-chain amino acid transport system substrate-binding protein